MLPWFGDAGFGSSMMALRRRAARWLRTGFGGRILGAVLVLAGVPLWAVAMLSLSPVHAALGVVSGGVLVAAGVGLILASL
jgi:hypothetical protein